MKRGKRNQRITAKTLRKIKVNEHNIDNYSKGKPANIVNELFADHELGAIYCRRCIERGFIGKLMKINNDLK